MSEQPESPRHVPGEPLVDPATMIRGAMRATYGCANPSPRQMWATEIRGLMRATVEGIIATGKALIQAKAELAHGEWQAMVLGDLGMDLRTVQVLMKLAHNPRFAKATNSTVLSVLPKALSTLTAIANLPEKAFNTAIETGKITPKTTAKQVQALVKPKPETGSMGLIQASKLGVPEVLAKHYGVTAVVPLESQETIYKQASFLLEQMTDETRKRFFAHIKETYSVDGKSH